MTLTQLRTFALVAGLGSLRAAAAALGVSEPAVSAAVAALRTDLGDALFVRAGTGIALTPGGRALAAHAREIVRLADRTRRDVLAGVVRRRPVARAGDDGLRGARRRPPGRRLHAPGPRAGGARSRAVRRSARPTALAEDAADIALGVRPVPLPDQALESRAVPALLAGRRRRTRASPRVPRRRRAVRAGRRPWLAGPAGIEPGSEEERWVAASGTRPDGRCPWRRRPPRWTRCAAGTASCSRWRISSGRDIRARRARPAARRGHAGHRRVVGQRPRAGRAAAGARALQRFLTTPDATTALLARPARPDRARPTVRVELWS